MPKSAWPSRLLTASRACLLVAVAAGCGEDSDPITEPIPSPASILAAAAGYHHSCALSSDEAAFCWGLNRPGGQVGDGTTLNRILPVAVHGNLSFRSLAAGGNHTCGISADGAAYCWGGNSFGQLGSGETEHASEPVAVVGGHSFATLEAGESHTCGLVEGGQAYCWGMNSQGQLGSGDNTHSSMPVAVAGGHSFALLFVGFEHTCGITDEGLAYCWGKNEKGQLGDGSQEPSTVPVAVQGDIVFRTNGSVRPASAGQNHTCAISVDNRAYCWGDNWHNQTGVEGSRDVFVTPQAVPTIPEVDRIAAGGDHSCAIALDDVAWCWGDAKYGQLGHGVSTDSEFNSPDEVSGSYRFADLSLGWDHSCGTTTGGEMYCWGYNGHGQLGTGDRTHGLGPVAVLFE